MTRGRAPRRAANMDFDAKLTADGFGDVMADLRGYADLAPQAREGLSSRVLAALRTEAAERGAIEAPPRRPGLLGRFGFSLGRASLRPLLAAAALVVALGAGAVFAATGRLPFDVPSFGAPADDPSWPPTEVLPSDENTGEDVDVEDDAATEESPESSEDVDGDEDEDADSDEDRDEDADGEHGDTDEDRDADEDHDGDQDADEDDDSSSNQGSDDGDYSSSNQGSNDGDDSNADDDSGSNQDGDDADGAQDGSGEQ